MRLYIHKSFIHLHFFKSIISFRMGQAYLHSHTCIHLCSSGQSLFYHTVLFRLKGTIQIKIFHFGGMPRAQPESQTRGSCCIVLSEPLLQFKYVSGSHTVLHSAFSFYCTVLVFNYGYRVQSVLLSSL